MIDKENFELMPFSEVSINLEKDSNSNTNFNFVFKRYVAKITNYYNAVLMHECNNFEKLGGRDIDTFYKYNTKTTNINDSEFFFYEKENKSLRFLINNKDATNFLNLDVEDLELFSPNTKKLNKKNFQEAFTCKKTDLKHFNLNAVVYYKIVKYFSHGTVFSYKQLFNLKKILNSLESKELNYILNLTASNLPKENIWIKKLINDDFKDFEFDDEVKNFFKKKRFARQNKRNVFKGKLKFKNLFKSKKFIYALIFGSYAIWPKRHNPLPAIAIVGNDGAGKTTICEYMIKNFYKMDPAYINMKSELPFMNFTSYCNRFFRKIINYKLIKKISFLKITLSLIAQSLNIIDQYIKYRVGMAFADSGCGITIFERYVTDKLRGEFPNKKNKFLPLEQFFPFPDGIFYLDVKPETSIERKVDDNHSIPEMNSKRKNYISLLEEFSEVKKSTYKDNFQDNIKNIKNYIFYLAFKKKIRTSLRVKRNVWKKNRNRVLVGNSEKRFQKSSFL